MLIWLFEEEKDLITEPASIFETRGVETRNFYLGPENGKGRILFMVSKTMGVFFSIHLHFLSFVASGKSLV